MEYRLLAFSRLFFKLDLIKILHRSLFYVVMQDINIKEKCHEQDLGCLNVCSLFCSG